jgi:S1-C subfamily serine protease
MLLLAALAGGCHGSGGPAAGTTVAASKPKARVKMSEKDIYKAATPAVVRIESTMPGGIAIGSGFIVDARGLVATNLHVVAGATKILVQLHDGKTELPVTNIVGYSQAHDLAIVSIQSPHALPTVTVGNSDQVAIGDEVVAIGNPLGMFDYTISSGLISQIRPVPDADITLLQISVPISQGSSGGPLFNQFGEVIGVTTGIITRGQNINIAVPANYLKPLFQGPPTALADFAEKTRAIAEAEADSDGQHHEDDNIQITRQVPVLPASVYDGCKQPDVEEIVKSISDAIELGAPLYNKETREGYEACYRIYEGAALKLEQSVACKGVKTAFGDGLLRAGTLGSYKEKAWAMRDTFDGLMLAFQAWSTGAPPLPSTKPSAPDHKK